MELRKCPNGHYYDASASGECPYCKNGNGDIGSTMSFANVQGGFGGSTIGNFDVPPSGFATAGMGVQDGSMHTMPLDSGYTAPVTGSTWSQQKSASPDNIQTVAVVSKQLGIDPVVGWLVCLNGAERGRDYKIHSENNFIGRSENMDICVRGDNTISRIRHAVITYDPLEKIFYFAPGEGRSVTRLNRKAVLGTVEIQAYDILQLGETKLLFIPLCGERFVWENDSE